MNKNSNPNKVMKNFLVCLFLLVIQLAYSQKKYHLDFALEFDVKINTHKSKKQKSKKDSTWFYMINSRANNFILFVNEKNEKNYNLVFSDREGLFVNSLVEKDLFLKLKPSTMSVKVYENQQIHISFKWTIMNLST